MIGMATVVSQVSGQVMKQKKMGGEWFGISQRGRGEAGV